MTAAEISVDRDVVGVGREFAVAIRTTPLAAAPPLSGPGAAYVIALDASPSMSWPAEKDGETSRWRLAVQAVVELVRQLPPGDRIGLVAFDHQARPLVVDRPVSELRGTLEAVLGNESPPPYGGTNIEEALETSYRMLANSPAPSRRVILFSDGDPNTGVTTAEGLAAPAQRAAQHDVYTDTIGMGADADVDLLLALSVGGGCGHVSSKEGARERVTEIAARLARWGQNVAAPGGELDVEVHPFFPVAGVYQLVPTRRRLEVSVRKGDGGGQRLVIPLGAVGAGDQQPLFVLRLTAPDRVVRRRVDIVEATGSLRGTNGGALGKAVGSVQGVAEQESAPRLDRLMAEIDAIDTEARIARRLNETEPSRYDEVYREAIEEAQSRGLDELAGTYEASLDGLRHGQAPGDVRNEQRATSSTSKTSANRLLQARPELDPGLVARGGGRESRADRADRLRRSRPDDGWGEDSETEDRRG
ncbi:vWA domain-containing protein [Thermomonospora umbrina]|uniref:von Willebrand factor type A domain-containing protein n=1 Tax=Thermomonospora umbrina TaxID=111806 RepID=A0A3D9SUQ3_9ACTN|nr:vWA domain-containing protein [Thermomonospora umbrina]REE97763.1 von Willebrand factor type A domain-containing protein [Thermomonospora umbrina]